MRYYKFPKWLKRFYPGAVWDFFLSDTSQKTIYLTFDDGPNPDSTDWILDLLDKHAAKATFFCLGKNVEQHPLLFQKLVTNKHQVANHTYSHLNGIHSNSQTYVADVEKAQALIDSKLFRPPYGRMTTKQHKILTEKGFKTVFWSHITYDFDPSLASAKRIEMALKRVKNQAIVVFHDSTKAFPQLQHELPLLLNKWTEEGYQFKALPNA
ncbi:MAG: polysaccharide deacetylase family protein [Crocinitomix sp.]|nr:polysaccharide deacetylase family protein [Crocinitomix sp.]